MKHQDTVKDKQVDYFAKNIVTHRTTSKETMAYVVSVVGKRNPTLTNEAIVT